MGGSTPQARDHRLRRVLEEYPSQISLGWVLDAAKPESRTTHQSSLLRLQGRGLHLVLKMLVFVGLSNVPSRPTPLAMP